MVKGWRPVSIREEIYERIKGYADKTGQGVSETLESLMDNPLQQTVIKQTVLLKKADLEYLYVLYEQLTARHIRHGTSEHDLMKKLQHELVISRETKIDYLKLDEEKDLQALERIAGVFLGWRPKRKGAKALERPKYDVDVEMLRAHLDRVLDSYEREIQRATNPQLRDLLETDYDMLRRHKAIFTEMPGVKK